MSGGGGGANGLGGANGISGLLNSPRFAQFRPQIEGLLSRFGSPQTPGARPTPGAPAVSQPPGSPSGFPQPVGRPPSTVNPYAGQGPNPGWGLPSPAASPMASPQASPATPQWGMASPRPMTQPPAAPPPPPMMPSPNGLPQQQLPWGPGGPTNIPGTYGY